jgi:glycosyltransferase involved in cell wall biosynthesis
MKILVFSPLNISSFNNNEKHSYNGINWVKSFINVLKEIEEIDIGVLFFSTLLKSEFIEGNIKYFPIYRAKLNPFRKLLKYHNLLNEPNNDSDILNIKESISNFSPDIIYVFGIESELASLQLEEYFKKPIIYHLQGLIYPYYFAFYPPDFSDFSAIRFGNFIRELLFNNGLISNKYRFLKKGKLELKLLNRISYVTGRTNWDRLYSSIVSPKIKYFHIDEVLRETFYLSANNHENSGELRFFTTISDNSYKGFDLIVKTAILLKNDFNYKFIWKVAGLSDLSYLVKIYERKYKIKISDLNILLLDVLDESNLFQELKNSDIYIHSSYIDNSPNSLCEAQILGLPVIACNTGGISSLINHMENGILVPTNDPFQLIYYINMLNTDNHL